MLREKRIPTKPRFDYVTQKAYEFLLECGFSRFPISPFEVLEQLSDQVICLRWSEAQTILKSDDPFHLMAQHADARTIRRRDNGLFLIVYDDVSVTNGDRITWTIMHEIGHIILGHLMDFGETSLDRGGLNKKKYGVLEIEAHYFAAEFLMPTALLRYFQDITVDEIHLLFGVSEPAARKKYNRVFDSTYLPSTIYDSKLLRNFYDFLSNDIDETIYKHIYRSLGLPEKSRYVPLCRKCPECYTYITDKNASYCPNCGVEIEPKREYKNLFAKSGDRQRFVRIPGRTHWSPFYIKTSVRGETIQKLRFCPTCLNTEMSSEANYCSICGHPLTNNCSVEKKPLALNECHCSSCGASGTMGEFYTAMDARRKAFYNPDSFDFVTDDWMEYPYWGYILMTLRSKKSSASVQVNAALALTKAFIDDNDNIIVFTDDAYAATIIHENKKVILEYACKADDICHEELEVHIKNDI